MIIYNLFLYFNIFMTKMTKYSKDIHNKNKDLPQTELPHSL